MSYRGRKKQEHIRDLDKYAQMLDQENLYSNRHRRSPGASGVRTRYLKRQKRKLLMEGEAEIRRQADELMARANKKLEEASYYWPWLPEASRDWMLTQAKELQAKAEELRKKAEKPQSVPVKAVKPRKNPVRKKYIEPHFSSTPYIPVGLWDKRCEREPDPQVIALAEAIRSGERNFMNGISYRINPVDTLKMISASSIFGEPQYYRDGRNSHAAILGNTYRVDQDFVKFSLNVLDPFQGMNTAQVMEQAIDEALTADFEATLQWAVELRERYLMRLNPQVILVRAAEHPGREAYTSAHPGEFVRIAQRVMSRGDDVTNQVQYWLEQHGSKKGIPAILKRSWSQRISSMDAYTMAKYGNRGIGLVDVVRICHAKGYLVDILMRDGKVPMPRGENTWERLRASGMGWADILNTIRIPHMALLRNLRGIFNEVRAPAVREKTLDQLKRGVRGGKQFPFRYLSAWKAVNAEGRPWSFQVQNALEDCMDIACENLQVMQGRCAFLSDNSGSAWGMCTSEWGTMHVAEIGNLSSVIGAMCAEEGVVFTFGDQLESIAIRRDEGVLKQAHQVGAIGKACGMSTENGIWLFFRDAIMQRQHWDHIFVYSDMQAGHGGLYGINPEDYSVLGACMSNGRNIDINMLVKLYREQVNPRVNVFCIQTAGYTNALVPEYGYRMAILCGWTGKELIFADAMNRLWNELESREPEKQ